jgi:hypothetical protein
MGLLDKTHPQYDGMKPDYDQMRDTYAGSRAVKHREEIYLAPTRSMILDGALNDIDPGKTAYQSYIDRAIFPDLVANAARTLTGLAFKDRSVYELPRALEELYDSATLDGESLETLHRRIIEQILLYGRFGLAVDVPDGEGLPYFVSYGARSIINWDDMMPARGRQNPYTFVVTAEETFRRGVNGDYEWTPINRYRAFELVDGVYQTWTEEDMQPPTEAFAPEYRGRTLDFVPFTIIGSQDLVAAPGPIPLLGISDSALAIYRGEADLRQTLHNVGQDTLVLIGVGDDTEADEDQQPVRVGSTAVIKLGADGDAKYIGVNGDGLTEQRLVLQNDYKNAASEGSRLLENTAAQAESGEALKVRIAAKTTTLTTVALTAAAGLTQALRQVAIWVGANPNEVKIVPNLDFAEDTFTAQQALNLMQAKREGLPLSALTIHTKMRDQDYTDLTFEDEIAQLQLEKDLGITDLLTPVNPVLENLAVEEPPIDPDSEQ